MTGPQRLFLLDGMALAYRAYFAFITRPLLNSKGENTGAIFGFTNTLMRIVEKERPDYIAAVFDTREPTFRHKRYSEYKATRQKMPEDMASQMDRLKDVVRAFNTPIVEVPGFEADDVIGTLARRAEREGVATYMVTPDKDFMQLVSQLTSIYRPGKGGGDYEIIRKEEVIAKFGVLPDQVIDVLGLMGDSSDNIPGVPGIGEKTAIPLIQRYGSIPALYERLDDVPQKGTREKLRNNRELAFLSRELVTIHTDVPVDIDFHTLKAAPPKPTELISLFRELEFRTLLPRLMEQSRDSIPQAPPSVSTDTVKHSIQTDEHSYTCITGRDNLQSLVVTLSRAKCLAVDTETTSQDPLNTTVIGISICAEPGVAFFIPLKPDSGDDRESGLISGEGWNDVEYDRQEALAFLKRILESEGTARVGQNIKFDLLALRSAGIDLQGDLFDTMVASYVLRPDTRHGLDALALEHLNYSKISYEELTGSGKNRRTLLETPLRLVAEYAAEDADITFRIAELQKKRLDIEGMTRLCSDIEFPLIRVLATMEQNGIRIDAAYLREMSHDLDRRIGILVSDIHRLAGVTFNINSTKQLADVLFDTLGLPTSRKTKSGFSTDVTVLETLRGTHPIIDSLLEYRMLTKLKSTYVDALPGLVNPRTGRVHTSYNQTVAATGRLASNDPNLQNIPIRTELGREIRRAFVPDSQEWCLLSADYSQIELRIMAHICGDEGLVQAFQQGEDIHTSTAAKIFGVPHNQVSQDMRRKAKEVNFGIMYGLSPFGLASRLGIGQSEAKDIITNYFLRFPGVKEYVHSTIADARRDGYVRTLLGRRRYLPDIGSRNHNVRSNAERQAINMPIQGTAADMIKKAMVSIDRSIVRRSLKSKMLLQVHDELLFEVPEEELTELRTLVHAGMKDALPLSVPVEVEIGTGDNWVDAH